MKALRSQMWDLEACPSSDSMVSLTSASAVLLEPSQQSFASIRQQSSQAAKVHIKALMLLTRNPCGRLRRPGGPSETPLAVCLVQLAAVQSVQGMGKETRLHVLPCQTLRRTPANTLLHTPRMGTQLQAPSRTHKCSRLSVITALHDQQRNLRAFRPVFRLVCHPSSPVRHILRTWSRFMRCRMDCKACRAGTPAWHRSWQSCESSR